MQYKQNRKSAEYHLPSKVNGISRRIAITPYKKHLNKRNNNTAWNYYYRRQTFVGITWLFIGFSAKYISQYRYGTENQSACTKRWQKAISVNWKWIIIGCYKRKYCRNLWYSKKIIIKNKISLSLPPLNNPFKNPPLLHPPQQRLLLSCIFILFSGITKTSFLIYFILWNNIVFGYKNVV